MSSSDVLLLYNEPVLPADHPDAASEAGVLESVEAVNAALESRGHRVRPLAAGPNPADLLAALAAMRPLGIVFNLFEGFGGVGSGEAEIAGLTELLGGTITGCPSECLSLVRDKPRTKWLLAGAGLPTPEFRLLSANEPVKHEELGRLLGRGPVIVKPAHEDASLGIGPGSIVTDLASLERQVRSVSQRYGAVLVEQFIAGREFNAGVIALPDLRLLPLAEIEFSGKGRAGWQIVTYDAKWTAGSADELTTPVRCPAQVDQATAERIREVALAAFRLTGCRDYARVDMRMNDLGEVFVLEINGNPDIGPSAGLARALRVAGIAYEEFCDSLVRTAAARRG